MNRWVISGLSVAVLGWLMPSPALAQRNFSRQQQASLQLYTSQLMQQERARQQMQLRNVQQQFNRQQTELQTQQNQFEQLTESLDQLNPNEAPGAVRFRPSRGTQAFGDMHFNSPYFQRVSPYYDYRFIQTYNRQGTSGGSGIVSGRTIPGGLGGY